jgi:hypothetical protein
MAEPFPRLVTDRYRRTSPPDVGYNCVAWAAGDTKHWWQPGVHWPLQTSRDNCGVDALEQAFVALGYEACPDERLEPGFEKVALCGYGFFYTHAARQLPDGRWTSKLGKAEDIEHDAPEDVAGGIYGEVVQVMKRPRPSNG